MTRRGFIQGVLAGAGTLLLQDGDPGHRAYAQPAPGGGLAPAQLLMDMVGRNPGEAPFVTHYNDPQFVKSLGYKSKVYESPQFGIDWSSVDPDIFPAGSPERAWVDTRAAELDQEYTACKAAGLDVLCFTDMVVFPKTLVEKYNLTNIGDMTDPGTQKYLRLLLQQCFSRFPQMDGLVIRIGETYLQGDPYHTSAMEDRNSPQKTIIPLMNLLRDEVCVNLNKRIVFRSWASFDIWPVDYMAVSDGVDPHPNLSIVVKHCEDDFHRGDRFSRVLGLGRHPQVIEVECQREYEGKGAYPNYIGHGVVEGFEENPGQSVRKIWANPIIAGLFTWSRGGGWKGPYITNELWCDLNVYVLSQWARQPNRSEEEVFNDYATKVLKLAPDDAAKFRQLCLLSADAVYRGIRDTHNDITSWWTRDQYMGVPPIPTDPEAVQRILDSKDEAVRMWTQIVALAKAIYFPDPATKEYAVISSLYGLYVYQIYRDGFYLAALGLNGDPAKIAPLIADYDKTWATYKELKVQHPSCATLYQDLAFLGKPGIGAMVDQLRAHIAAAAPAAAG